MINEKKYLLTKINKLISERKEIILKKIPNIHEIDDGVIIRFFTSWDNCEDDDVIKFKRIVNHDDPNESVVLFYIPKGSYFDLRQRFYIGCITCLNGKISVTFKNNTTYLEGYSKICVESDEVEGIADENTYLITTSNRLDWSEETREHVNEVHGK